MINEKTIIEQLNELYNKSEISLQEKIILTDEVRDKNYENIKDIVNLESGSPIEKSMRSAKRIVKEKKQPSSNDLLNNILNNQEQQILYQKTIKNWITFFGVLYVLGLIIGVISVLITVL